MGAPVSVVHVESGQLFKSMKAASDYFNINRERINGKSKPLPGLTFERIEVPTDRTLLRIPHIEGEEEFKPIPGYEGLYSISNKGRVRSDRFKGRFKKYSTTTQGQHIIVLSKNSIPTPFTVESIYNKVWRDIDPSPCRFWAQHKVPIYCLDDHATFESMKACCMHYGISYTKFVRVCNSTDDNTFSCNGHVFMKYA